MPRAPRKTSTLWRGEPLRSCLENHHPSPMLTEVGTYFASSRPKHTTSARQSAHSARRMLPGRASSSSRPAREGASNDEGDETSLRIALPARVTDDGHLVGVWSERA